MANQEYFKDARRGVCTECHSDQPDSYMNRNVFYRSNSPVPCRYCGGVVVVMKVTDRAKGLKQIDRQRGVPKND